MYVCVYVCLKSTRQNASPLIQSWNDPDFEMHTHFPDVLQIEKLDLERKMTDVWHSALLP